MHDIGDLKQEYRRILRTFINKKNHGKLKNNNITIISSNCLAGVIYHELNLEFLSPTINLRLSPSDFIKFVDNLEYYLGKDILEDKTKKMGYPVGQLDDLTIYYVHYRNFEEAKNKWQERCQRINFEKMYFVMSERDGCTYEDIRNFENLKYKNKIIFTHKNYPEFKNSYYINN